MVVIIILFTVTFLVLFIQAVIINHVKHQLIDSGIIEIHRHFKGEEVIVNKVFNVKDLPELQRKLEERWKEIRNYLHDSGVIRKEIDYSEPSYKYKALKVATAEDLTKLRQELATAVKEMHEISNNSSECLAVEIGRIREKHAKLAQYLNVAFIPAAIEAKEGYYRKLEPTKATGKTKKS